jgi:hypothetical protein
MKRVFPAIFLCLFLIGCKDPYGACVKASADIGTGIAQGMKTVDTMRVNGQITSAEESNVLDYLEYANGADRAFLTCSQAVHTSGAKAGSFTACASTFSVSLAAPDKLALLHVSNPNSEQNIMLTIQAVSTAVNAIVSALGGA